LVGKRSVNHVPRDSGTTVISPRLRASGVKFLFCRSPGRGDPATRDHPISFRRLRGRCGYSAWRCFLLLASWTGHNPHLRAPYHQFLGNKHAILEFAGATDKIAYLDVGKRDALAASLERGVFVYLNVLALVVRAGDGNPGFIDGLHFAGNKLFA